MPAPALGLPRARWKGWGGCKSGAGRVRGSREPPEGEELLVRGSPAATALEHPFLGLWPSGCLFRLQGPRAGAGSCRRSLANPRAAIFSWRRGRGGTIYRSNNPRSLRQWNPACVTRADIPGPPSRPASSGSPSPCLPLAASRRNRAAPRALVWPELARPRASVAPPPLPVRHGALIMEPQECPKDGHSSLPDASTVSPREDRGPLAGSGLGLPEEDPPSAHLPQVSHNHGSSPKPAAL